jgi:hypothetical protein
MISPPAIMFDESRTSIEPAISAQVIRFTAFLPIICQNKPAEFFELLLARDTDFRILLFGQMSQLHFVHAAAGSGILSKTICFMGEFS